MAQRKVQSNQLSDTGVVPGPYSSANITVDSSGRITSAANGSSGGVTSITVDGTSGRVTSSGSPITSSGTITLDLATTSVTPGSYTSSNITIDAYGRITAAANGSSVPALPDNQIAYGSPLNVITSSADFTYDDTTGTLKVGPTGSPALVTANTGQSITVEGDTSAQFKSGVNTFGINSTGAVLVNASAGLAGEVLTSDGPGSNAYWAPAGGGGGVQMNVYQLYGANDTFGGALVGNWSTVNQRDESETTVWGNWDSYAGSFECLVKGVYDVVVHCQVVGDTFGDGKWPDNTTTSYGTDLGEAFPAIVYQPSLKIHIRNADSNVLNSASPSEAASTSSFTERFIVASDVGGLVFPKMFASSYSTSGATATFSMTISFMRISDYTVS